MKGILSTLIIILWGLWAFLFKIGGEKIGIKRAVFYAYLVTLIISVGVILYLSKELSGAIYDKNCLYVIGATLCGFAGTVLWYIVLQKYKASIVVPFTALYPLVTVLLSVLILKEKISLTNAIGILLAIVAGILLSA